MKTLRIDDHAHEILQKAREEAKKQGIENASMSDAVRYLAGSVEQKTINHKPLSSIFLPSFVSANSPFSQTLSHPLYELNP